MLRKEGAKHAQRVYSSVRWSDTPYKDSDDDNRLLRSWERSLDDYRLDPGRTAQPRILTAASLKDHLEPLESFLRIAKHGVRTLYEQVADANYVVLLTDGDGVTIDFVGNAHQDRELKKAGLYLGSVWTESEEGTCGVGTAIIDKKPIVVHKREHFRAPNTTLTCSSAPIFDVDGSLLGILDASALYSPDDKKSQNLVLRLVTLAAGMIENAHFLNRFKHDWVLQLSRSAEFLQVKTDDLIAFDERGAILATNRCADQELLAGTKHKSMRIEDLFQVRIEELLRVGGNNHQAFPLRMMSSAQQFFARVRMPETESPGFAAPRHPDGTNATNPRFTQTADPKGGRVQSRPSDRATKSLRGDGKNTAHATAPFKTPDEMSPNGLIPADGLRKAPAAEQDERTRIIAMLRAHQWQVHATARALGMSRATIYRKLAKHSIVSPNKAESAEPSIPEH